METNYKSVFRSEYVILNFHFQFKSCGKMSNDLPPLVVAIFYNKKFTSKCKKISNNRQVYHKLLYQGKLKNDLK